MIKAAIIRGRNLNQWEMQNFEPLATRIDITAIGATDGLYPIGAIRLPVRQLATEDRLYRQLGRAARAATRLGLWEAPRDYLAGLAEALDGVTIAHAAELHLPLSEQAINLRKENGCKVVVTCWETLPYAYEEEPEVRARRALVRSQADLFLATSKRAAAALRMEGVADARIRVVMPGVDVERFSPGPRNPRLLAELGLPADAVVVLFIARLIREKGVRELILAFDLMRRRLPAALAGRCRLVLAGSGPLDGFAAALIRERGLAGAAQLTGGRDYSQIHELHRLADVFVLPSIPTPYWEEQFGMVLAEAMACGRAVVATASGAIPEVVGDSRGVLVPPLEVEALAEALTRVVEDRDFRASLEQANRERACRLFDRRAVAEQILAAYQSLAAGGVA